MNNDALDDYKAMTAKERRQVLLIEYRCKTKGCLLLHAWQQPEGRFWYLPGYDLSPEVVESETAESARQKRTVDGYRKWIERAASLDHLLDFFSEAPDTGGLSLTCDHVRQVITTTELATDLEGTRPGTPTKRFV
jgi:hypothetical protein